MCYPSVNELWKNLYKSLVLLLYGNHYCTQKDVPEENVYEVDQELGFGELSPSACMVLCFFGSSRERRKGIIRRGHDLRLTHYSPLGATRVIACEQALHLGDLHFAARHLISNAPL